LGDTGSLRRNKVLIVAASIDSRFTIIDSRLFFSGIETDELDSNAEEFEDESVEFFIKEEITEVEE